MEMQKQNKSDRSIAVIILNSSLVKGELHQKLEANPFFRVRVSQSTEKNSIIFPRKSLAFMVIAITEMTNAWPPSGEKLLNEDVVKRIEKFYTIHRNCSLLLLARMTTDMEFKVLREIQKRCNVVKVLFTRERNRSTSFRIVPKSGTLKGCVYTGTLQIEQFRSKNGRTKKVIRKAERYAIVPFPSDQADGKHVNRTIAFPSEHKTELITDTQHTKEQLNIQRGGLPEEMIQNILEKNIGVTSHQSLVLLDSCYNIANVACYTAEDLIEKTPLSSDVAKKVEAFFEKDRPHV